MHTSKFFIVFTFGFYINKLKIYDKIMNYKNAFFTFSLAAFFSLDFSQFFNNDNQVEAIKFSIYHDIRIIMLTLGLVLLTLIVLRKLKVPKNGFIKKISSKSAFIYLSEPFISFIILTYVFNKADNVVFASGVAFYLYQAVRAIVLLVFVPLGFILWKQSYQKRISLRTPTIPIKENWIKHLTLKVEKYIIDTV
ncbi:MAG: hypothetical protein NWE98_03705 [Candidatus Bathyarchaeota archaeon]|nr:hypothetical protein [Candidatus Bathyarchaeota archaeon]